MLSKFLLIFACLVIAACSGNSSSKISVPDTNLKRFSGVVNNSSVSGANVAAIPVGKHGQFRLNSDNQIDSTSLSSDERGRYGILIKTEEDGAYVVSVNAPNAPVLNTSGDEVEVDIAPAKMRCQIVNGCLILGQVIAFGDTYPMPSRWQWSAAVEFISDGQFVVINPITEMATLLGFSSYVNSPTDSGVTLGTIAAPGYYSSYGIAKGNSQTAALLGLTDILSVEPINLFNLHNISINESTSLQDSIRYGALVAAWQELELNYNKGLVEGDFTFQQQVIFEFINNKSLNQEGQYIQGQLYQAEPLNGQKLSMKSWYSTAVANLIAARNYHTSLARSVPNEVNLVIARLQQEIAGFKDGVLTTAKPRITEKLQAEYADAIAKSKAMVNYVSDLRNNFASEEYRDNVRASSTLATEEVKRLATKFDALAKQLLSIQQYYLSCTHDSCDAASPWHTASNTYVASTQKLTIVQFADTKLELSQIKIFNDAAPEGSKETFLHDLLMVGSLEFDGLRFEFSDFTPNNAATINSSTRFVFSKALSELPQLPALIEGGKGARVDEDLVPDGIELTLPAFKLFDKTTLGTDKELTLSGAFRTLLAANRDVGDFSEAVDDKDKLGKRYNLANVNATLRIVGSKQGTSGDIELRDNAVLSFQAVASEAVASTENIAAYFPDTVYPTLESFFKPRESYTVGTTSDVPLVISRRGIMDFPELNSEGVEQGDRTVPVDYLELDYEIGGLERYVAYPRIGSDDKFWGLLCTANPDDENKLVGRSWTVEETNSEGDKVTRALLACNVVRDRFKGDATPDNLINKIYAQNKNLVSLREYNGQGAYRMDYPTEVKGKDEDGEDIVGLQSFPQEDSPHKGVIEQSIVLGVDSMRLQFQPELVNSAATGFLADTVFDVSLVWRRHDLIDANVFLSFNADENYQNPNGSGLPYLGVGSDVESYSVAYRTDEKGNEVGEFVFAWSGIQFVDGPVDGEKVMQRTSDANLKEGFIVGIGSNVEYRDFTLREKEALSKSGLSDEKIASRQEEKCGFFDRGQETAEGENCSAIAYLTFRGLVTGTLREERDGSYVIRYVDGTWQVLGVK